MIRKLYNYPTPPIRDIKGKETSKGKKPFNLWLSVGVSKLDFQSGFVLLTVLCGPCGALCLLASGLFCFHEDIPV